MSYIGLKEERIDWRQKLEEGSWEDPNVLKLYRINRNSDLWRSTREVEKLCEMILFLEGTNPMSESYVVHCDQCKGDISCNNESSSYRIRLIEEHRAISNPDQAFGERELDRFMNFCNIAHLKEWLTQW